MIEIHGIIFFRVLDLLKRPIFYVTMISDFYIHIVL